MHVRTEHRGLSRRSFLKSSAVVAGAAWAGCALGCSKPEPEAPETDSVVADAEQPAGNDGSQQQLTKASGTDKTFNVCCRPNCFNTCMMTATVREGKLVKTAPADFPDKSFNRICLRGLVSNENIYNPERVLYPMRQTGERGSDNWEKVSWDEARSMPVTGTDSCASTATAGPLGRATTPATT